MDKIIAYCGLICDDCPAYVATQANDQAALEQMAAQAREEFGIPHATAEAVMCDACLTDQGRKGGYCYECEVRACATSRDLVNCAHCFEHLRPGGCMKLEGFLEHNPGARAVLDEVRGSLDPSKDIMCVMRIYFSRRTVQAIEDRGKWGRRIAEIKLDGDEVLFFKSGPQDSFGLTKEPRVARLFQDNGLTAPDMLIVDNSSILIHDDYVIQQRLGGAKLGDLLNQVSASDAQAIYETLGRFYGKMHAIHNERAGWWVDSPDELYDELPGDFMYNTEIAGGSGALLLERGRITPRTYERALAVWTEHKDYLEDHQPALVHGSPLLWSIYLEQDETSQEWSIVKLMALNNVLWWDPAYDLAFLRYPPFGEVSPARWEAFARGYGPMPERKRFLLYAVLQRFCAAGGKYWEPQTARNRAWAAKCLDDVDVFLDEIEQEESNG